MKITPGQKIGVCGRTGSGKSSLLSALLRLLDLDSGTIIIDGQDLQKLPREVIRTRMIAIPQDPFILSETVRINAGMHPFPIFKFACFEGGERL